VMVKEGTMEKMSMGFYVWHQTQQVTFQNWKTISYCTRKWKQQYIKAGVQFTIHLKYQPKGRWLSYT
jgi:hypothetical protein